MAASLDGAALALWRDVPVTVSDGSVLRADVWRPAAGEPVPAILVRTPYGKERAVPSGVLDPATAVAATAITSFRPPRGNSRR